MKVQDVKESIAKIKRVVTDFAGLVSPDEIQSVLVELGVVDQFFTKERVIFQNISLSKQIETILDCKK